MEHAFAAHPGKDPEHMILSYAVALSQHEARALKPLGHKLDVNFNEVDIPFALYDGRDVKCSMKYVNVIAQIVGDPLLPDNQQAKWQLEEQFQWTTFEVRDIRRAYVLLRKIAAQVENTMILSMPLAPYYGFTKTFNIRFDVPREITEFEPLRRSIIARGG